MKYATSEIVFSLWSDAEELLGLARAVGETEREARAAVREMLGHVQDADVKKRIHWRDICDHQLGSAEAAIREIAERIQWRLKQLQEDLRLRPRKPYKLTPHKMAAIQKWRKAKKKDRISLKALAQELGLSRQSVYTAIRLIEAGTCCCLTSTRPKLFRK